MRFDRLKLEQFKCYEEADLRLDAGVTVIHGLNGSGKSSLLEACFFALYGAKALDRTLEDVVTIGAEESVVELWFTQAGERYHVRRRVRVRDERAVTAECVLEGPEGTVEGARDVRERVTDLLRMDHEAFVNCAYVRQGEVNKLINATPAQRQDMLDDLLQLGTLEEYRERASQARLGVKHVRDDKQGALSEVEGRIEEKEAEGLHDRLSDLRGTLAAVTEEIDRFEENRADAEETLAEAETVLEEHEGKRADLAEAEETIDDLRERVETTEREREQLAEQIDQHRQRLTELRGRRDELLADTSLETADPETIEGQVADLEAEVESVTERIRERSVEKREHESEAERLAERAEELEDEADELRTEADDIEAEVAEGRELVAEKREQIADIEANIERHREAFDEAPVDVGEAADHRETVAEDLADCREKRAGVAEQLDAARERLAEAERLREEGKCPECGQPVEGSPHVAAIEERREAVAELETELTELRDREQRREERLEWAESLAERETELARLRERLNSARQLVEQKEAQLEERAEQVEDRLEEAADREAEAERLRAEAAEEREAATERQQEIAECNREKSALAERIDRLEALAETVADIDDVESDIEDARETRTEKADRNTERRERLAELRERRDDLREAVEGARVEEAREEKRRAEDYLEKVTPKLEELRERRDSLQAKVGAVENELEELEELRDRRDALAETVDGLESLYEETEQLEEMYGDLRAQLRQRNVETLERTLNETFDLVYGNDTYARIELDGEYRLTVHGKDGETLDPDQLSGGERAIFNLSLRCAIYRLLAEGIEGAAPTPPLVLDEPTVFLDSGHVTRLVDLIGAMRDHGVEQILVVSHDEELVAAADDLVRVTTDPRTNRSTAERTDSVDRQLLAEVGAEGTESGTDAGTGD